MRKTSFSRRNFLKAASVGLAGLPLLSVRAAVEKTRKDKGYLVYIGTFAKPEDESIFLYRLNPATGALARVGATKGGANPTYLTLDARQQFLYAVIETNEYQGAKSGSVRAFAIDRKSGALTLLNEQSSFGTGPCYISLDHTGHCALVANYAGGSVCVLPVRASGQLSAPSATDQHTGTGPHKNQAIPHAHCFLTDPTNKRALAVNLGTDKILSYQLDPVRGTFQLNPAPAFTAKPGAGPRHLVFHPNNQFAYLINELNSTMTALTYSTATGTFQELQTLPTLPADFTGENSCADVHVSPNGRFLYGSNRGHNSIVVYAIDPGTGQLTLVQHVDTQGKTPRNFALDPSGRILLVANQNTNNIFTFHINPQTGQLTPTGNSIELPAPVCLKVVPDLS